MSRRRRKKLQRWVNRAHPPSLKLSVTLVSTGGYGLLTASAATTTPLPTAVPVRGHGHLEAGVTAAGRFATVTLVGGIPRVHTIRAAFTYHASFADATDAAAQATGRSFVVDLKCCDTRARSSWDVDRLIGQMRLEAKSGAERRLRELRGDDRTVVPNIERKSQALRKGQPRGGYSSTRWPDAC
jgi:hypothetical protein